MQETPIFAVLIEYGIKALYFIMLTTLKYKVLDWILKQ